MRRWGVLFCLISWVGCAGESDSETVGSQQSSLCTKPTLSADDTGPVPIGTPIVLTAAAATCAPGETAEYRFFLRREGVDAAAKQVRAYDVARQLTLDTSSLAPGRYTASVYSRAVGRTATRDAYSTLSLLIGPTCSSVTVSATPAPPQLPGPPAQVSALATCSEGSTPQFRLVVTPPGGAAVEVGGWSDTAFQWNTAGLAAGPYTLEVFARAAGNASSYEARRSLDYRLGATCTQLEGTITPPQAAPPGTAVAISALATCSGGTPAQYRFTFRRGRSGAFQELAPWGGAQASWDTTGLATDAYQVQIAARAADFAGPAQVTKTLSYNVGGVCSATTLSVSPKSPRPLGTLLTLTSSATCVGAPVEYRFLHRSPVATEYRELSPWAPAASVTLDTQAVPAGLQSLQVQARVAGGSASQQASRTVSYALGDVCNSVTLSASSASPQPAGTAASLTAVAKCVFGGVPEYRFARLVGGAWQTFRDWGGATASIADLPEGAHSLRVETRGQGHQGGAEASRTLGYTFGPPCPTGYQSSGLNTCVDLDECLTNNGGCHPLTLCSNAPGSYECGPCPAGYSGDGSSGCQDIDECATDNGGCHPLTACSNTEGSRLCSPCPVGYSGSAGNCVDIDECQINHGGCSPLRECSNSPGGFECGPCPSGYTTSGASGCTDIDECASANGGCDPLSTCTNTTGGRECGPCPPGHSGTGSSSCQDIDECATANGGCDALTSCHNLTGSFECGPCPPGYGGDGQSGCIAPPNPCSPNPCQNGGTCSPSGASFGCTCAGGFGGESCEIAPATLLAAGDVGDCATTTDTATGLLLGEHAGTIAALGDLAYPNGTAANFSNCFQPVWGAHKQRMKPVPGNHEYVTAGAAGYFGYFGALAGEPSKGYYSYQLGTWHVVALNSNCTRVSCSAGSAQETWLRQDLAAHPGACTLAYWHHPRFSSGEHGNDSSLTALWKALGDHGVELVLSGHDHDYERFAPQNESGAATPGGVVQFVVGTGGTSLRPFEAPLPNSLARNASDHGVLKLTLSAGSYAWAFLPVAGKSYSDSGTTTCH